MQGVPNNLAVELVGQVLPRVRAVLSGRQRRLKPGALFIVEGVEALERSAVNPKRPEASFV